MLNAIRDEYPQAFIGWAVEPPTNQLLSLHPAIDQIIEIPKGWMKQRKCWKNLTGRLREFQFDIAIDPQGMTKSAMLGWLSGAKTRVGARGRWGREFSPWLNNRLIQPRAEHLVDRSRELLKAIGIATPSSRFDLPVCPASASAMDSFLSENHLTGSFATINPGASWPSKRWELDRLAAVARYCHERYEIRSVVCWAGEEEHEMARQIEAMAADAVIIAPKTSLRELAAMCQRSSFFIGGDTGPLHIASAMGTPCIGLHGTTKPQESGAYGPQHIAIARWYQSGTSRERRNAGNDAMQSITVADVTAAIDRMMNATDPRWTTMSSVHPHTDFSSLEPLPSGRQKSISQ